LPNNWRAAPFADKTMPEHPPTGWRSISTSLAYRIAAWTVWYWRFDALADERHFTEMAPDEGLQALPPAGKAGRGTFVFPAYPVSAAPPAVAAREGRLVYTPKTFPNYYVDLKLEGGFERYLQGFSSKSRSTLKRKVRRYAEADSTGELHWRVYRSPEEIAEFLPQAGALSARTYQARLLDVGLPEGPEFRAQAMALAASGQARGFILFLDGRPAAYVYCSCRNGVATYDYVGHDPALNALSPGTVLQYKILEYLFEDPQMRVFDFTEGEGEHKAMFATGRMLCAKSLVFGLRPGIRLLVRLHWLTGRADEALDALLDRLGIRRALRRLIRRA